MVDPREQGVQAMDGRGVVVAFGSAREAQRIDVIEDRLVIPSHGTPFATEIAVRSW